MVLKVGDFKTDVHNDWCPGCGDFGIVNAIQMALAEMEFLDINLQYSQVLDALERHLISLMFLEYILCTDEF